MAIPRSGARGGERRPAKFKVQSSKLEVQSSKLKAQSSKLKGSSRAPRGKSGSTMAAGQAGQRPPPWAGRAGRGVCRLLLLPSAFRFMETAASRSTPEASQTVAGGRRGAATSGPHAPSRRHPGGGARGRGPRRLASLRDALARARPPPGVSLADSLDPRLPSGTPQRGLGFRTQVQGRMVGPTAEPGREVEQDDVAAGRHPRHPRSRVEP